MFENLQAGVGYVVEVPAINFAAGGPLENLYSSTGNTPTSDPIDDVDGDDEGIDPANQGDSVFSAPVILTADEESDTEDPDFNQAHPLDAMSNLTIDFGFTGLAIGNRVFLDTDVEDGVQDPFTEPGVGGVTVELYAAGDLTTPVSTTVTDGRGFYLFTSLTAGDYVVQIPASMFETGAPLAGYTSTEGNDTTPVTVDTVDVAPDPDDDFDLDDNGDGGYLGPISSEPVTLTHTLEPDDEVDLADGTHDEPVDFNVNLTVDFGFVITPSLSLGNRVWADMNNSGTIDGGEAGLANIWVDLYLDADADGVPDSDMAFQQTGTDENGYYLFTGLGEGTYIVEIPAMEWEEGQPLVGYHTSTGNAATNDDGDSLDDGIDTTDGAVRSEPVVLSFYDEPPGEGDVGPQTDPSSDDNSNITVDFGFYSLTLGNQVWYDADNGGRHDEGEAGIENVWVELWIDADADGIADDVNGDGKIDDADMLAMDTTDANGYYLFGGLAEGTYLVSIPAIEWIDDGPLSGLASSTGNTDADEDADLTDDGIDPANIGETVWSSPVSLTAAGEPTSEENLASILDDGPVDNNANVSVDFGFYPLAGIGDYVWFDENRDGIQDDGEKPVKGVMVTLINTDDKTVGTAVTDENGYYEFRGLVPGGYQIRFDIGTLPDGYILTKRDAGSDDATDSDADFVTGLTILTTLDAGEFDPTWDMGIHLHEVDLAIVKTLGVAPIGDAAAVWHLTVKNEGPDADPGPITVTDDLVAGLSYTGAKGEGWTCDNDDQIVTCVYPTGLAAGETTPRLDINTDVPATGTALTNSASVKGISFETTTTNNLSQAVVTRPVAPVDKSTALAFTGGSAGLLFGIATLFIATGGITFAYTRRRTDERR